MIPGSVRHAANLGEGHEVGQGVGDPGGQDDEDGHRTADLTIQGLTRIYFRIFGPRYLQSSSSSW